MLQKHKNNDPKDLLRLQIFPKIKDIHKSVKQNVRQNSYVCWGFPMVKLDVFSSW